VAGRVAELTAAFPLYARFREQHSAANADHVAAHA
jgi:hypothetical protein